MSNIQKTHEDTIRDKMSHVSDVLTEQEFKNFKGAFLSYYLTNQKDMKRCQPTDIIACLLKAAKDGVMVDGKEAMIVVRYVKDAGKDMPVYQPMVGGVVKMLLSDTEVESVTCHLVYEQEIKDGRFSYVTGDQENLVHEPIIFGQKGAAVGAYAILHYKSGHKKREFMGIDAIEKARKMSKMDFVWKNHFEEMAKKTVLHRLNKRVSSSPKVDEALAQEILTVKEQAIQEIQELKQSLPQEQLALIESKVPLDEERLSEFSDEKVNAIRNRVSQEASNVQGI